MPRITLQEVARHSGYSIGTVSRALSGRGSVSKSAMAKIQASAKALGYRPDPAMSALASYRHQSRDQSGQAAHTTEIEVILNPRMKNSPWELPLIKGLKQTAQSYGFELNFSCPNGSPDELRNILHHAHQRYVRFVILAPAQGFDITTMRLDWSPFDVISLTSSWEQFGFHVVAPDHYSNTFLTCKRLHEAGAGRIGFFSFGHMDRIAGYKFSAAVAAFEKSFLPDQEPIPTYNHDTDVSAFRDWLNMYQPDTLLTCLGLQDEDITSFLKMTGDRNLVHMYVDRPPCTRFMDQRMHEVGSQAIRLVKQLILLRLHAMPGFPIHQYIPGMFMG